MTTYNDTLTETIVHTGDYQTSADVGEALSNVITALGSAPTVQSVVVANSSILFTPTVTIYHITTLLDALMVASTTNTTVNTSQLVSSTFTILQTLLVQFDALIEDSLVTTEEFIDFVSKFEDLINTLTILSPATSQLDGLSTILQLVRILDSTAFGLLEIVTSSVLITQALATVKESAKEFIDSVVLTESYSHNSLIVVPLTDSIDHTESYSNSFIGNLSLTETFLIKLPEVLGDDTFLAYTFSPENASITTYTNYPFIGSALFNDKYLLINSTGLYEYGGVDDDGSVITAYLKTAGLTFGSSNKKSIPHIYLGYSSDGVTYLKVSMDGKGEFTYKLNKYSNELDTKKIDIGKGLIGRYFQFEFISQADEFNLESIDFTPMVIGRKL